MKISISTNVSLADFNIIKFTVPSWLRVFDNYIQEVVIVVDPQKPDGRLAKQYTKYAELEYLMESVNYLAKLDNRIRVEILLNGNDMDKVLEKWFINEYPYRCQSGTPISAFINAVEVCNSDFILRCDCDFLFFEDGFLKEAFSRLHSEDFDIIEPPMLGFPEDLLSHASLGAFMMFKKNFANKCLPMKAHKLDLLRIIHRKLRFRPTFLNLEEMISIEKVENRIKHCRLNSNLGFSMHLPKRDIVLLPNFQNVIDNFERGVIPETQISAGRNFDPNLWAKQYWQ